MSKIEKALDRAKQSRGMALVRTSNSHPPPSDTETAQVKTASGKRSIARKATSDAIVRMNETSLRSASELVSAGIITPALGENATVQSFRDIRTRILQHTRGQNGTILVTSAATGSGGSFVARNLAAAFAFDAGRTSLLVDCNLRKPSLQSLLQDPDARGITDYLEDPELKVADIIYPVGIERLRVVPAGTVHQAPAEYFMSDRAQQLFLEIRDRYAERFVVLDAPPILESADTRILVEMCDHVLLVVPYARLTNVQIDSCTKAIDAHKLIGIIFNDEPYLPPIEFNSASVRKILKDNLSSMYDHVRQGLSELIKRKSQI